MNDRPYKVQAETVYSRAFSFATLERAERAAREMAREYGTAIVHKRGEMGWLGIRWADGRFEVERHGSWADAEAGS